MNKRLGAAVWLAAGMLGGAPAWGQATQEGTGLAPALANQPLTINAYLGTVEGQPLFVEDVFRPIDADLQRLARVARTVGEFRQMARDVVQKQVNVLINDGLIVRAAKEALTEDDQRRLDAYMNKIHKDLLSQHGGAVATAEQALRAKGSSLDKELADRRRRAIVDIYLHKKLWPKITVTRQKVMEEYTRKIQDYTVAPEVDLYTITIPVSRFLKETDPATGRQRNIRNPSEAQVEQALADATRQARELIAKIKADEDFAALAEAHSVDAKASHGGRWPHTRQGQLALEELEKAAFALAANSVGEPLVIKREDAARSLVVVVKVGESQAARVIPFAEAQKDIERKLREAQYVTLTNEYYRKLQQQAAVEGLENMVETATEAAVARYAVK